MTDNRETCPDCGGQGQVPVGEYQVTREMAMDAQNPELEGMPCGEAYDYCQRCGGEGTVEVDYLGEYHNG